MINRFKFSPSLFSAIGYADTRPLETAISPKDPANRRVEILILKNRYKREFETRNDFTLNLTKAQQEAIQKQREQIIRAVEGDSISPAARKLFQRAIWSFISIWIKKLVIKALCLQLKDV